MTLKTIDPVTLKRRLDDGDVILVDIREPNEYAREHIRGARLMPLSRLDAYDFARERGSPIVFHCKSGSRTASNASRLLAKGCDAYVLTGDLDAWKRAGLPTDLDRSAPIDLQRQVQIVAGLTVLVGETLGFAVSSWFFALSVFVGVGLTVAGITGFCGMARLLVVMPWNHRLLANVR